ncbi:N-acetyltransferase [Candidatus Collierbacteria bacterium]|nr:N-acetyltransferase [Candidatus Collierbacteria bacterium]
MIDKTVLIHSSAKIGVGTVIWGLTQIREGVVIGEGCIIGRNVYIDKGVIIGNRVKIQNNSLIYYPAVIGEGVFIGPGAILTNDKYPRSVTPKGDLKSSDSWKAKGVVIEEGASVGAGVVVIAGVKIGKWALVGAGAVVTKNVPEYTLVAGNPARILGKVDKFGKRRK